MCTIHPKFLKGERKSLFCIKIGDHELPYQMVKGLVTLPICHPTDEELESCEVLQLTSDAHWDPDCVHGNDFIPGSDVHVHQRSRVGSNRISNTTSHTSTIKEVNDNKVIIPSNPPSIALKASEFSIFKDEGSEFL